MFRQTSDDYWASKKKGFKWKKYLILIVWVIIIVVFLAYDRMAQMPVSLFSSKVAVMNRLTEFSVPHSISSMSPTQLMWVTIPFWRDDIDDVDFERHPVVAIRSFIEHVYEGDGDVAPHHSELVKNGWIFLRTEIRSDVLFCDLDLGTLRATLDLQAIGIIYAIHTGERTSAEANAASKMVCDEFRRRTAQPQLSEYEHNIEELIINLQREDQTKNQRVRNIQQLLRYKPDIKLSSFAKMIGRPASWIIDLLDFRKTLHQEILGYLSLDVIPLASCFALSLLPMEEQPVFKIRASELTSTEFIPIVSARRKDIKEAKRAERSQYKKIRPF